MQALLVEAPGRYGLVERPEPSPGEGEVLVRVEAVGVCGSDLEILDGTRPAALVRYPIVPGHEWAGRVEALGPGTAGLAPGDRVAVEGHPYCGRCPSCRGGETQLCQRYGEIGFVTDGGCQELVAVRADLAHRFQSDLPLRYAALAEPSACSSGTTRER